jgi:hypothetical protein
VTSTGSLQCAVLTQLHSPWEGRASVPDARVVVELVFMESSLPLRTTAGGTHRNTQEGFFGATAPPQNGNAIAVR